MAVGIGVREDDDLAVADARQVEVLAQAAAERRDEIGQLLVLEHLRKRSALGVEHLPAEGEYRLARAIAPLLGRPAGGIPFDDEDLAVVAPGLRPVPPLPPQCHPPAPPPLRPDLLL